jgi:hypothetical protein
MANRSKQIVDRAQGDGQARTLSNLQIATHYLDPGYKIIPRQLVRGDTGLLRVFSLLPHSPGKPGFEARVDDGSPGRRRSPDLDFDMTGATETAHNDFKAHRNGYVGHHSTRSSNHNHRIFHVQIGTPAGMVFDGNVSFNVTFSVSVTTTVNSTVTANAYMIRAPLITRFRNHLKAALGNARPRLQNLFRSPRRDGI